MPTEGTLLVRIDRTAEGYRYTRTQGGVRRPGGYYEEGALTLVQLDWRHYLRGVLEQSQQGAPHARISVEFEVLSSSQLLLRGSIFADVQTGEVQEFFAVRHLRGLQVRSAAEAVWREPSLLSALDRHRPAGRHGVGRALSLLDA